MHGLAIIGSWMGVASLGVVIGSVNIWAVVNVFDHRTPFGTRCAGYKDVFQLFLYLNISYYGCKCCA